MALPTNPTFRVTMTGSEVTNFDKTSTWIAGEKTETIHSIKDTDGYVSLQYSFVDTIKLIMVEGSGTFLLKFTTASTSLEFEITDSFIFNPTPAFFATLTNIQIKTASTTAVIIKAKFYGVGV